MPSLKTIIDETEYLTAEHELSPMTVSVDADNSKLCACRNYVRSFAQYAEAKLRNARELITAANKIEDLLQLLFFCRNPCSIKY